MPRHPLGRLDAFLEGALAPRQEQRIRRHLSQCAVCTDAAAQRAPVLRAARQACSRPATAAPQGPGVMAERGVSGRAVVVILTLALVSAAVVTAVWMAGAPAERTASTTGLSEAARVVQAPSSASTPTAARAAVDELRAGGWSVPSLQAAGLELRSVSANEDNGIAEVVALWANDVVRVEVHECRSLQDQAAAEACPQSSAAADSATQTERAPWGLDYTVSREDEESWAAAFSSPQAHYVVVSSLPVERIEPLLSLVSVADKSRVARAPGDDDARGRFERGMDRLLDFGGAGMAVVPSRGSSGLEYSDFS
ncbi:MAG: zf-HC2 domain-containing protein [Micrococcus sp.]|nr:zf-HC2 domain-containing protein [Micrococcus sp.]